MNTVRGLRDVIETIGDKHAGEPDSDTRDSCYEDEEEIELHGDDLARASLDGEL